MNILMTIYRYLGHGGAEVSTKLLAEQLIKRGHEVTIASAYPYEGIETRVFRKFKNWPVVFLQQIYLTRFISDILKEKKIDIVYPQDMLTTKGSIVAAKKNDLPLAIHLRDYWFACPRSTCVKPDFSECKVCSYRDLIRCMPLRRLPWEFQKLHMIKSSWDMFNSADYIFVGDKISEEKLKKCGVTSNIKIVYNCRDISYFQKPTARLAFKERYGLGDFVITFVGSLTYTKGFHILVKVMPSILKFNPDVSFLVVGSGTLEKEIREAAEKEGLEKRVVLTGRLDYSEMPAVYASSDLVLLPTIWHEPFGGTQIEAAAAGVPIIGSNVGGVRDGLFGIYVEPSDLKGWEEAINSLIRNEKRRRDLSLKGQKVAEEFFSVESYVDKIESCLEKAVEA